MSGVMNPPESIYNLIPKEEVKSEKPPRYTSKFRHQVKQEKQQNKAFNKTMGPSKVDVPPPDKYLLKHSKEPQLPERKPFLYHEDFQPRKPPVPARTEKPLMGICSKMDFVKSNVIKNKMAVPRKPQPACAHTRHGDKQVLQNSGLVPQFIKKKDYGQTPQYLSQRQEEVRREQEEYEQYVQERMKEEAMKQLSEEERQEILHGLKKNWDELQHQYQGLSLVIDTLPKKHRKLQLEAEMKQLEKDIELMERHKIIYIAKS
ncbi:enkurin-like [Clarias gariepinus]|uniref:enkurin-like n=1 Tax=Clarias gariepinus TaxID=13013 RepID=UPI00234C5A30|nr:enkurin-like [Clarias gariepinus]